jgi:DNA-directed DNA polymerase III PolC
MAKIKNYINPHTHIKSFDAASTVEKFAKRELELETGYITITDHGTLEGTRQVYDICKKEKFKGKLTPILGVEGYFRDDNCPIFQKLGIEKDEKGLYKEYIKYTHITMHFLDQEAFFAGSRILSLADNKAETHGSERKPLFTWENLEELGQYNITMTSGCLIGMISRHLLKNNDIASAISYYEKLRSIPKPGNFYVEVFPHVCDKDYQVGVYFQYEDGSEEKFPVWKSIKTKQGEFKAEQIANEFKNNKIKAERHERIMEVMNYRKWEQLADSKKILNVEKREGFLKNECRDFSPDGDVQLGANKILIALAEKYGDKILISDDAHFAYPEEKILQDIRLNQRELEKGLSASWIFPNSHHRLSTADAKAYFDARLPISEAKLSEWVENSYEWASKFKGFKFEDRKTLPTSFYPKETLKHTIDTINEVGRMDWNSPVQVERLASEIELLHKNGTIDLLPYFMIDQEVCNLYLQHGELTGPGRGSAAGLLLTYLTDVTHVDPLKYDLSRDRFMTPDRVKSGKMPDIDQDLPHRNLLVDPEDSSKGWLKDRFGDCVAQISTESTLKLKSSIKDVFRAQHGSVPPEIERFCKQLPDPPQGVSDRDFVFGYEANGEWNTGLIESNEELLKFSKDYNKEWDIIKDLMGLVRQRGRHASAYIIADTPIYNFIPLTTVGGVKVTQFNMGGVEAMGGLKMDFLVVNILNDIRDAIRLIQDRSGVNDVDWASARKFNQKPPRLTIDKKKVPYIRVVPFKGKLLDIWDLPEDHKVLNSICEGDTESVFQFNTPGAKLWLKYFNTIKYSQGNVKALDSIEALSAFTALDRPGPLNAKVSDSTGKEHNMLVEFANRARGGNRVGSIAYLDEAIPETFGVIVYQEQLEKMFRELGGTSAATAEEFRRAVAKKEMKKVLQFKNTFMEGAVATVGSDDAEKLWSQFITFGQYGFNKSHSVCYVTISYACAFLKYYFPLEWWTAVLKNAERNEIDEKFWPNCGHLIDMPDVQNSEHSFAIKNERIKAPLSLLHGIGEKAHQQLTSYAPYQSLEDFCNKIQLHKENNATTTTEEVKDKKTGLLQKVVKKKMGKSALNSKVVTTLIVSGAMDSLFPKTKQITLDGNVISLNIEPVDKILMYQEELAKATGKKLTSKKKEEFENAFKNLSEIKQFQLKKKVLPAYCEDITGICLRMDDSKFFKKEEEIHFSTHPNKSVAIYGDILIQALKQPGEVLLLNGLEGSVIAYVIAERRFTYGDSTKKTAVELIVDINGERLKLVQWPSEDGKLPKSFENNLNGAIVVLTLNKKSDKAIRMKGLYLVEPGIDSKIIEEEEESK